MSTVIYKNETFRFVSFGGGNTVTAAKEGKFYNFKVEEVEIKFSNEKEGELD